MPTITLNKFIDTYTTGVCLNMNFVDYIRIKKAHKGKPIILNNTGGKIVPTPNNVARALCRLLNVDYHLRGFRSGSIQQIITPFIADLSPIYSIISCSQPRAVNALPCTSAIDTVVDARNHIALAVQLGLI